MARDCTPMLRVSVSIDRPFQVDFTHRVRFTRNALDTNNTTLAAAFSESSGEERGIRRRAIVFIDSAVAAAHPQLDQRLRDYFDAHASMGGAMPEIRAVEAIVGGEACKNDNRAVERVIAATHEHAIDRKSFVVAIGGGALLDAVGLGAALAHRGVRLVRLPTTTLAMDDAAMGVKNGINRFGKKNFVGAFAVPWAVVCDESFLASLTDGHWRAGFSEAVKIACLKEPELLDQIERDADAIRARSLDRASPVIRRSATLHLAHITQGGDAFELAQARPLDFGHWAAHRIEALTRFEVSHGDAVSIGIALDCEYAVRAGMLAAPIAARVRALLDRLGLPTWHPILADQAQLIEGIEEFREHLGGRLNITMLTGIGRSTEVHEMNRELVASSAQALAPSVVR
jgi:3-dehydroquinate synthase